MLLDGLDLASRGGSEQADGTFRVPFKGSLYTPSSLGGTYYVDLSRSKKRRACCSRSGVRGERSSLLDADGTGHLQPRAENSGRRHLESIGLI